jgi:hypothetical protein
MPNSWNAFIRDCRDRYGVATLEHARRWGIADATFYRRTDREGWGQGYPGVRTAPWVTPSPYTDLSALLHAAGGHAAATGSTAAWLHGLRAVPTRLEVAIPHGLRVPIGAERRVRRHRWLRDTDRGVVQKLSVLHVPATVLTLADERPIELRALVIDALHRDLTELGTLGARLTEVGPIAGRRQLARILHDLADREVESIFHDLVLDELTRRGYRPGREPVPVETPDGRGAHPDIPLEDWRVAIEVEGDRFHRTRAQRAAGRRKSSQYAGSRWLVLELDWWEWMGNREHFFQALDAAILAQIRYGVAETSTLPPHLRTDPPRVQNVSAGADPRETEDRRTR